MLPRRNPATDGFVVADIGLHHAGKANMAKLGGPPGAFYEANEGLAILAIQRKTKGHG